MDSTPLPHHPEPEPQPQPKKLKMSTSDEDEPNTSTTTSTTSTINATREPRYKRRKIAILFAYCGVGYQGMQKNPGAKTIEADLEEALYQAGAIPEPDRGKPQRFEWARSARTDKGVSAVGQVVSGRFYIDPPGFIHRLNSNLPNQIRIFGFKRVTNSFSAKKFCDRRRYVYLIPVFALDCNAHRDRESVLASLGSENELVKCLECSERGRSRHKIDKIELNYDANEVSEGMEEKPDLNLMQCGNGEAKSGFCYGEKEKERFNRVLSYYVGTHNFHNFTTRIKAEDPSATRYIVSFTANSVFMVDGIEFVKCEVVGQSFMLHQIRKLIGLAVAIMRGCAPESLIDVALQKNVKITVPTAPEVGLYLDECFFTSYNEKWKDTHEEITIGDFAEQAEDFKMKQVYLHIAAMEQNEGSVAVWLHSLNHRNYPDLRYMEGSGAGKNGVEDGGAGKNGVEDGGAGKNGVEDGGAGKNGVEDGGISKNDVEDGGLSKNGVEDGGLSKNDVEDGGLSKNDVEDGRAGANGENGQADNEADHVLVDENGSLTT